MPIVDPWGGTVAGLRSLNDTFGDLERQRIARLEEARRMREDESQAEFRKQQTELGGLQLEKIKEGMAQDRAYKQGLSSLESSMGPDLSPQDKMQKRIEYALSTGHHEAIRGIVSVMDLTEKLANNDPYNRFTKAVKSYKDAGFDSESINSMLPSLMKKSGIDPSKYPGIRMAKNGTIFTPVPPDMGGGAIAQVTTPDGETKVVHISPQKDESIRQDELAYKRDYLQYQRDQLKAAKTGGYPLGKGGKPTASIQNIEYLVQNGWSRKDAEDIILRSKPISRDTFVAQMTKAVYANPFILDEDKDRVIENAKKFFDTNIGKAIPSAPEGKELDEATATSILKEAGGDKEKARKIAKDRGYKF